MIVVRVSGGVLNTIYQPGKKSRHLAWERDLNLGALLEAGRRAKRAAAGGGRRHRKPSTSRGKFRKLGQESDDEETAAMLRHDSIDEKSGEEIA